MLEQLNSEVGLILNEAYISETSVDKRFNTEQKQWIRDREGGAFYPILDNEGDLYDLGIAPKKGINVHHIHTIAHNRSYFGERDPNHPLNGIALPRDFHNSLHRDWINGYKWDYLELPESYKRSLSEQAYIAMQTAKGKPSWLHKYDEVLCSIATINSYYFLKRQRPFPFKEKYLEDIENAFLWLDPKFKDKYIWLRRNPQGTPLNI